MSQFKVFISLPFYLFISTCGASSTTMPQDIIATAMPQIQKPALEISCQDLQNPAYQQVIMNAINEIRQHPRQCGQQYFAAVAPLRWNSGLHRSSLAHAQDMAEHNFLGHTSSTGLNLRSRLQLYQVKTRGGGENVARGQKNLDEVMATWGSSPVHCSNLMQSKFTDYAVACSFDESEKPKAYWVQQFGVR